MRAKRVVLTHFSQRYPKLPAVPGTADVARVAVAFDLMRVELGAGAWPEVPRDGDRDRAARERLALRGLLAAESQLAGEAGDTI